MIYIKKKYRINKEIIKETIGLLSIILLYLFVLNESLIKIIEIDKKWKITILSILFIYILYYLLPLKKSKIK